MSARRDALKVQVIGGELRISIGVETLAFAFECSEGVNQYSEQHGDWRPTMKVVSADQFALDVVNEMLDEEEDGSSAVTTFLDTICLAAANNGTQGVEDVEP